MDTISNDLTYIEELIDKTFFREPTEEDRERNKKNKNAFKKFADSGWIPPHLDFINLSISDIVRLSEESSDTISSFIYSKFTANNYRGCKLLIKRLKRIKFANPQYFNSAMLLYNKKNYLGCCMMEFALIEQILRYSTKKKGAVHTNVNSFLSYIFGANKVKFSGYSEHPTKYLMGASLQNVLEKYFEDAKDFERDDSNDKLINRNYLLHGMTKRQCEHIDCIKLFVIIDFLGKYI